MSVEFDVPNYQSLMLKVLEKSVVKAGNAVEEEAKIKAPVDKGGYRNNIKYNGKDEVEASVEYSAAIEYGISNPKTIKPVTAKALRFEINGKVVYAKSAKQKTRKPNPVMRNAAKKVQKDVPNIVKRELSNV